MKLMLAGEVVDLDEFTSKKDNKPMTKVSLRLDETHGRGIVEVMLAGKSPHDYGEHAVFEVEGEFARAPWVRRTMDAA
jgi:hypothetical protein